MRRYRYRTCRPLYRDPEQGMMMGVCAGIADYFDVQLLVVRGLAILLLIMFFVPTAVVYVTTGLLLREKPLRFYGRRRGLGEDRFWRSGSHH